MIRAKPVLVAFTGNFVFYPHFVAIYGNILSKQIKYVRREAGVLPERLGWGVRPASQNLYPICDQNLRFSLPYLWPDQKFDFLFMTWPKDEYAV